MIPGSFLFIPPAKEGRGEYHDRTSNQRMVRTSELILDFGTVYVVAHHDRTGMCHGAWSSPNFPVETILHSVEFPWQSNVITFRHHITVITLYLLRATTTTNGSDGSEG